MDVASPIEGIFPTVDSAVLRVLCASNDWKTGRQVAIDAQRSVSAVALVLERLVNNGLVESEAAGRAYVYRFNSEHLAAPAISSLVFLRQELFDRIRTSVAEWTEKPLNVSVFGSTARGDGDTESDIDILIVIDNEATLSGEDLEAQNEVWTEQIDKLSDAVWKWTGNYAGLSLVGSDDLARLDDVEGGVWRDVLSDGVHIYGRSIGNLVRQ